MINMISGLHQQCCLPTKFQKSVWTPSLKTWSTWLVVSTSNVACQLNSSHCEPAHSRHDQQISGLHQQCCLPTKFQKSVWTPSLKTWSTWLVVSTSNVACQLNSRSHQQCVNPLTQDMINMISGLHQQCCLPTKFQKSVWTPSLKTWSTWLVVSTSNVACQLNSRSQCEPPHSRHDQHD